MTTDKRLTYLRQLMSRLLHSGVDGSDIGELVAEMSQHLDDTGEDPMAEFGSVSDFAVEVIAQRRVSKRSWFQRVALLWLSIVPFAIGFAALVSHQEDGSTFVAASEAASGFTLMVAIVAGVTVIVRRQRGDQPRPFLLGMGVAALVSLVGTLMADLIGPETGVTLSSAQRWTVIVLGFALAIGALFLARNPVRFPKSFDGGHITRSPLLNLMRKSGS